MANYRGCHKGEKLLFYQIKIVVKQYKRDEFVESMRSFARKIRKEKGCLEYSLCRDIEKENTYSVVGEWKTRKAVEKHFQTHDFEVFIGAARVLGETFEMNIGEVLKTGGFKLAREQMDNGILTIRGERKQEKKY